MDRRRWIQPAIIAIAVLVLAGGDARALSLPDTNLVDLMANSTSVFRGIVTAVSDGVDQTGLPYTEVTVQISETLAGTEKGIYTFRQFGLMNARLTADGSKIMLPAPDGIPRYTVGEDVLLFMGEPASITGLRAPYTLGAGKFVFGPGRAENGLGNAGLFRNVSLDKSLVTDSVTRLLSTKVGAVNPDDFWSLVRRAEKENWIANGLMWRTDKGRPSSN